MDWKEMYREKLVSLEKAASTVKSGERIAMSPCSGSPIQLMEAIANRWEELEDVKVYSGLLLHPFASALNPKLKGHIEHVAYFSGPIERKGISLGMVHPASVHFSKIDKYVEKVMKPTLTILDVPPMDEEGYFSFGPMGVSLDAISARLSENVIVQVNKHQPSVKGGEDTKIHIKDVTWITEFDHPLPELPQPEPSEIDNQIAAYIVPEVPDGATIQIGLGGLSNAVGYALAEKKNLSAHTEMITDSMLYLSQQGALSGKIKGGFALGKKALYEFAGTSDQVELAPIYEVNNPQVIGDIDNFVSINACIMVDLTGQVASEGVGHTLISGTGGALDFVEGATVSTGGKSFICVSSVSEVKGKKVSNIVPTLPSGTPVTIPRASVQYIVTEYGIADLFLKGIEERVEALIQIAHPEFRDELRTFALEKGLLRR